MQESGYSFNVKLDIVIVIPAIKREDEEDTVYSRNLNICVLKAKGD